MEKSKVYFTSMKVNAGTNLLKKLNHLVREAGIANIDFENKYTAIKIHFGEPGNLAYLRPNYAKVIVDLVKELGGKPFLTDCNTLYVGRRKNALDHLDSAYENGYNPFATGCHVIIADGLKGTDEALVPVNGEYVKEAKIGRAVMDADIVISLNHFKGHESTGFGGAFIDHNKCVGCGRCIGACPEDAVKAGTDEANDILNYKIAEYTYAVIHGRPNFHISLVIDVSPYCDCHAENDIPIVPDIGMFASFDPVALDQACADAVNRQPVIEGSVLSEKEHCHHDHFTDTHPDTNWESCLEHAVKMGMGSREYELIEIK